jgi:MFS family permease
VTTAPSGPLRPDGVFSGPYRRLSIGILATVGVVAFEGMAVATVMPVAVAELGGLPWYAWGFSAFLIASLVAMVVAGEWCDRRGPRGVFVVAGGLFAAGLSRPAWRPGCRCSSRPGRCRASAWAW